MTVFFQLTSSTDKAAGLFSVCAAFDDRVFIVDLTRLARIPTMPLAYWVSERVLELFDREAKGQVIPREAKNGLGTMGDFRFVRLTEEVEGDGQSSWPDFCKGGRRSHFFQEVRTAVNWAADGAAVKAHVVHRYGGGHWSRNVRSVSHYRRPGLTWPLRGSTFSAQAVQRDGIFSVGGKMMFARSEDDLLLLLGLSNSKAFDSLVLLFAGKLTGVQYESGLIESVPIPDISPADQDFIRSAALSLWRAEQYEATFNTASHFFVAPRLLSVGGPTLAARAAACDRAREERRARAADLFEQLNTRVDELYGLGDEFVANTARLFPAADDSVSEAVPADFDEPDVEPGEVDGLPPGDHRFEKYVIELLAWLIGVALGRFDIRSGRSRREDRAIGPFDELPRPAPGLLMDDIGRLGFAPSTYPIDVEPWAVLDPGHPRDLVNLTRSIVAELFGNEADDVWEELLDVVVPGDGDMRTWISKRFFDQHLRVHSAAQRKAPVLWPIGTRSGSYLVWLYAHRMSPDSLFKVLNDVVAPKVKLEEQKLTRLRQEAGLAATAVQRKIIDKQESFVGELGELRQGIEEVAALWAPNLGDGIVIVLAPLWRLFAHHRAWSNELKLRWKKLANGDYDWAQIAMHIWPERVIPKCAEDRSLAIAHNLEDVFWVPDDVNPDRWHPRPTPTIPIEQLITERSNPTVRIARNRPQP